MADPPTPPASPDSATDPLFESLYSELRAVAGHFMRRGRGPQTLSPTVLVHEAYLRLASKPKLDWVDRPHFLRVASKVLRHTLAEYARRKQASKRGGNWMRVTLQSVETDDSTTVDFLDMEEALSDLESLDERKARVVELKYFCGLTNLEAADALQVSKATIEADWRFARAWLSRRLKEASG